MHIDHPIAWFMAVLAAVAGAFSTGVLSQVAGSGSTVVDYTAVILAGFAFLTLLVNTWVAFQAKHSAESAVKAQEDTKVEITTAQRSIDETKDKVQEVHLIINSRFSAFEKMIAEKELARGDLQGRAALLAEQAAQAGEDAIIRERAGGVVSVVDQTTASETPSKARTQADVIADVHRDVITGEGKAPDAPHEK